MTAWGFHNGQFSPRSFAAKAKLEGYKWAALELDDDETGAYNRALWPSFRDECRGHDLIPGVWVTEGGNLWMAPGDSAFAIAEVEGPGDYEGVINVINGVGAGPLPTCSLAICTNFNTPLTTQEAAAPLIAANLTCMTEAYMNANPNADPDGLDAMARRLGWPTSQPVFGMYPVNGVPPPTYAEWQDWPGVDYLAEYVL